MEYKDEIKDIKTGRDDEERNKNREREKVRGIESRIEIETDRD